MKYITDESIIKPEFNYLLNDRGKLSLIFNNFKTSKYLGQQVFRVKPKLGRILLSLNREHGDFLFQQVFSKKKFQQTYLSKYIKTLLFKATGVKLSLNDLRHSKITNEINRVNVSMKVRRDLAYKMAHGLETQLSYMRLK